MLEFRLYRGKSLMLVATPEYVGLWCGLVLRGMWGYIWPGKLTQPFARSAELCAGCSLTTAQLALVQPGLFHSRCGKFSLVWAYITFWSVGRSGHRAHSSHSFLYCRLCQAGGFIPHPEVMPLSRGTEIWGWVAGTFPPPKRKHDDVIQARSCSMTLQGNDETVLQCSSFATKSDFPVAGAATTIERLNRGIQPILPVFELPK